MRDRRGSGGGLRFFLANHSTGFEGNSWLSAALSGRFTGSGAIFAGDSTNVYEKIASQAAADAASAGKNDLNNALGKAANSLVGAISPGSFIATPTVQLITVGVLAWALFFRKKG